MCSMSVLCPLCTQTSFESIDALRTSLIKAANGPLACPICQELFLGLDKLTIHLFSHTSIIGGSAATATTTPKSVTSAATTSNQPLTELKTLKDTTVSSSTPKAMTLPKEKKAKKSKQMKTDQAATTNTAAAAVTATMATVTAAATKCDIQAQLSVCDICEFTFRNEELRDMHFRLVHQNSSKNNNTATAVKTQDFTTTSLPTATSTAVLNSSTQQQLDFKCHLCAKTFKMKGSLRVHLKVVHLMGLPYVNNFPKLSICDRIRHKEAKIVNTAVKQQQNTQQQQVANVATTTNTLSQQQQQQQQPSPHTQHTTTNATQTNSSFSIGTLTLLPAAATTTSGSLLNINSNGDLVRSSHTDATTNVLLVFNTNPNVSIAPSTLPSSSSTSSLSPPQTDLEQDSAATIAGAAVTACSSSKSNLDNAKIWECDVCAKSFTTKYFLKKHKRLHTGEMPYTCEICARTFTFQQSYHKHLLYHSDQKPHVCTVCGRAFKELSTLQNHVRIHSGEKPFKCEVCGKCFRQRVSFLVHTRIHTGVMPYKCEICEKSFRYKVSQRTHKCLTKVEAATINNNSNESDADQISENFIKAFLESTSAQLGESQNSPASAEIANITAECKENLYSKVILDEVLLSKTIDDIVVESCNKLGIGNNIHSMPSTAATTTNICNFTSAECNDGSNSPSRKLQNMRLYSPQLVTTTDMDDIHSGFPRFLLDDVANN